MGQQKSVRAKFELIRMTKLHFGKMTIEIYFYVCSILIFFLFLVASQWIINHLRKEALEVAGTYAQLYATATSEGMSGKSVSSTFTEIIKRTRIPIIVTDTEGVPRQWRKVDIDFEKYTHEDLEKLKQMVRRMDRRNTPIVLHYHGSDQVFGYLHFGNLPLVDSLWLFPFIQISLLVVFIVLAIGGYRYLRDQEKQNLWVGLAKETAHQLGTPLSSLMGWNEILRTELSNGEGVDVKGLHALVQEIEKDIAGLKKVTDRFSFIGSIPEFKDIDLNPLIREMTSYFQNRFPQHGKKINLILDLDPNLPKIHGNRELLEWVIENLIKNSLDAITKTYGEIQIRTFYVENLHSVMITHTDNGHGISAEIHDQLFKPGFTTKKRGWGLGLSIVRRVVELYHHGEIEVLESVPDERTTFQIVLPVGHIMEKRKKLFRQEIRANA